jgi:hypothetical protein
MIKTLQTLERLWPTNHYLIPCLRVFILSPSPRCVVYRGDSGVNIKLAFTLERIVEKKGVLQHSIAEALH